mgnify:CR=1 FL=1
MKIQEAIKACQKTPDSFGRPVSWKGSGKAIDLARRMKKDHISEVTVIHKGAAWGSDWKILPEELLDVWEVVDINFLAGELKS